MEETENYKKCSQCKELKLATTQYFPKRTVSKDGLDAQCKACVKIYQAVWRTKNQLKLEQIDLHVPLQEKLCPHCHKFYLATTTYFYKYSSAPDGLSCWCKACIKAKQKTYYTQHKKQCLQMSKIYAKDHKDEMQKYQKAYRKENSKKHKDYNTIK